MKLIIITSLFILFLCSCKEQSKQTEGSFGLEVIIKHTVRNPMIEAWWPDQPIILDSVLILSSSKLGENFIRFFSLKDFQEIAAYGQIGRGPGEFLAPDPFSSDDSTFYIHDWNRYRVSRYALKRDKDTLLLNELFTNKEFTYGEGDPTGWYSNLCRFNENYYIGFGYKSQNQFFVLLDSNLCFLRYFGDSPVQEEVDPLDAYNRLNGACRVSDGIMVYATYDLPYIACYTMKDSVPVKLWEENYYKSFYAVRNKQVLFSKEKTRGYMAGLSVTSRYIYVAFNDYLRIERDDETRPETWLADRIFVFDREGHHMGVLKPDVRIREMCVSNDDKTLYAILDQPDYAIATFDLPEW